MPLNSKALRDAMGMVRVYQTASIGEAHIRVTIVNDRGQADILLHRVANWGHAQGDALWFITRDRQDADCWFYPCSVGMAQLRVCFVDSPGEAGWQTQDHRLKGRLHV